MQPDYQKSPKLPLISVIIPAYNAQVNISATPPAKAELFYEKRNSGY